MAANKTNRSNKTHGPRSREQTAALVRIFGELPVVDADADFLVCPKHEDIEKAVPSDPEHCVFAECCRRTYDSKSVVFFHRIAYVDLPQPDGSRAVVRYELPDKTRMLIEDFDRNNTVHPGGYLLKAPAPHKRLDAMRENKAENRSRKRQAIITGEVSDSVESATPKANGRKKSITIGVRNGSGRVHFARVAE